MQGYFISLGDEHGSNRALAPSLSSKLWEANGEELINAVYKGWTDRLVKLIKHDAMSKHPSRMTQTIFEDRISIILGRMKAINYFPLKDEEIRKMRAIISERLSLNDD